MGPYTPDLLRRPMMPCNSIASASSTNATINGGNGRQNSNFSNQRMASNLTRPHSQSNGKHQICSNNNMIFYKQQLDNYLNSDHASSSNSDSTEWRRVKCVLVGDAAVGKTSLIVSYTTNGYPQEYVPTAFDNYTVSVRVDNQPIKLQLCDTAGQDEFDTLRPLCYPNSDVFLVCFSVVNPTSFENLKSRWIPEISHHSPKTPFILVGTESDLRTNIKVLLDLHRHQMTPILESQARRYAEDIGAAMYLECSSLTQQNLKETFDAAILVGMGSTAPVDASKNRRSITAIAANAINQPARKSLRKLKEKLTTVRTTGMDSSKNPSLLIRPTNFAQEIPSVERCSTHSSASHLQIKNLQNKKKLSTASVPTLRGEMNAVIMNSDGVCNDHFYDARTPDQLSEPIDSQSSKSKKGWRKLLCVA